jgi:hypothetical protein
MHIKPKKSILFQVPTKKGITAIAVLWPVCVGLPLGRGLFIWRLI